MDGRRSRRNRSMAGQGPPDITDGGRPERATPAGTMRWVNTAAPGPETPAAVRECRERRHTIVNVLLAAIADLPGPADAAYDAAVQTAAAAWDRTARDTANAGFALTAEHDPPSAGPQFPAGLWRCVSISCKHQQCRAQGLDSVTMCTSSATAVSGLRASGLATAAAEDLPSRCAQHRSSITERVVAALVTTDGFADPADVDPGVGLVLALSDDSNKMTLTCEHDACHDSGKGSMCAYWKDIERIAAALQPG